MPRGTSVAQRPRKKTAVLPTTPPRDLKGQAKKLGKSSALHGLSRARKPPKNHARRERPPTPRLPPGILYSLLEDPDGLQANQHLVVDEERGRPVHTHPLPPLKILLHQFGVAGFLVISL